MTFVETLEHVRELLQSKGRISYRALKRQFALDDEYVEDLKAELIDAEAYGKAGQVEEGLAALAEALKVIDKDGERFYEAELYRLKGKLLLAQEVKMQKAKGKNPKISIPTPKS